VKPPPDPDEPLVAYRVHESGSPEKRWDLELYPDFIGLEEPDERWHEIDRADVAEKVQALDRALFLRRVLVVTLRKKTVFLQLTPESFDAVKAWIGPPTQADLLAALQRRLRWITPIGLLFVFAALPIGGMDWDVVMLGLGLGLILTARLSKLWPHRVFFAVDALWFLCLAANSVWLLTQEWNGLRLGLLVLQLMLVRSGLKEYHRFAALKDADPDARERESGDRDEWER
jgi:hypothetical protein